MAAKPKAIYRPMTPREKARWGAKHMIAAMFKGFMALPGKRGPSCWDVLGISPNHATEEFVMEAYRRNAKQMHPDKGGSHEAMSELNEAKDTALSTIRNR